MRCTVSGCGHETPVDALQSLAELVVRIRVHAADKVVLLVGHDPRTGAVAVVPGALGTEVSGLHGAVAVIAAVGLGVAVVEAASGVVMVAADDPVLAFSLVVNCGAVGIVPP